MRIPAMGFGSAGMAGWLVCTALASAWQAAAPGPSAPAANGPRAIDGDTVPTAAIERQALASIRSLELASLLETERKDWATREAELLGRIDALTTELEAERKLRIGRESEWLEFTQALAVLEVEAAPGPPSFVQAMLDAAAEAPDPEAEARAEAERLRSAEMLRDLRALLAAEQVFGLDVLEVGVVGEDRAGPFVARLVDDFGRPVGTLAADSLRLEISAAAHTVTLILEGGYEHRSGLRVPFAGVAEGPTSGDAGRTGVRRIHLPSVNPQPWIEAFPELLDLEGSTPLDDGQWELAAVRARINDLMMRSSGGSGWRLRGLGGVWRDELRDVQFAELGPTGRVERRLFADRVTLRPEGRGMRMDLIGGVQVRGDQRVPFLDGRYRIVLPHADGAAWVAAGLPGLGDAEEADGPAVEAAAEPDAEDPPQAPAQGSASDLSEAPAGG